MFTNVYNLYKVQNKKQNFARTEETIPNKHPGSRLGPERTQYTPIIVKTKQSIYHLLGTTQA